MKFPKLVTGAALLMAGLAGGPILADEPEAVKMDAFVEKMVTEHGFDRDELTGLLAEIKVREDILEAIARPAEGLPWYKYRPIFMKPNRINAGVDFWREHAETLERAEKQYQVPAEIIVAIIGVETFYGKIQGSYPVVEALYTLGFHYPKRSKFFAGELEQFLILSREQDWDLGEPKGSYAGAMGMGQFIPSSYRNYAVDFDGDGKRNLFSNQVDAIGSVANYFAEHGWKLGEPVATHIDVSPELAKPLLNEGLKPQHSYREMLAAGIRADEQLADDAIAGIYGYEQPDGEDYWLGYHNFYVITRYNRSPLYAMAVHQLSQAIRAGRLAEQLEQEADGDNLAAGEARND